MKRHIEYFDGIASEWDNLCPDEERIRDIVETFNILPWEIILDVGCGTGMLIRHLHKRLHNTVCITGLDFSLEMLRQALRKEFDGMPRFVCGCAEELPIKSGIFDRIICFAVFPHLMDKEKAVREFNRVLKRNGKLNIFHLSAREELNDFHASLQGVVNSDILPDEDTIRNILEDSGFTQITAVNRSGLNRTDCIKK